MEKFRIPIRYGVIGMLVSCILGFIGYLFYRQLFSSWGSQITFGIISFGIGLFILIWGGINFRKDNNNVLSFGNAFLGVFIISALMMFGASLMNYVIPNFIDQQYSEDLYRIVNETTRDRLERMNLSEAEIDKAMDRVKMEDFKPTPLKALQGFGIGLAFYGVISLIVAAFIKRNPDAVVPPPADVVNPV